MPRARGRTTKQCRRARARWGHWVAAAVFGIGSATPVPLPADGDTTYKYREDDGTVWFTDRRPSGSEYDDYEFIGYHGRPPARSSCRGLSQQERARRIERIERPLSRFARRYGADELLIKAMISVESCFDPKAVSRVGARGLLQLMPETARAMGVTDAFDVNQNLRGGIEYFQRLRERFPGDLEAALAAYNAGPDAVERHGGIPPYDQTQRYVSRVLKQLEAYRDGETRR